MLGWYRGRISIGLHLFVILILFVRTFCLNLFPAHLHFMKGIFKGKMSTCTVASKVGGVQ